MDPVTSDPRIARTVGRFLAQAEAALDFAFDPVVDIHSGEIYGFRAGLSDYDRLGFESRDALAEHAASLACTLDLEKLLLRKVLAKFAQVASCERAKLFLNLAAQAGTEEEEDLLEVLRETVAAHRLLPWNICLDIPELLDHTRYANLRRFALSARDRGFALSLDDFGSGFSRMHMLYDVEPTVLKIDRDFITALQSDARKRLFVSSLVDFAHVLGIRVIATNVETVAELQACRSVGCDLVQGSLVARPIGETDTIRPAYPLPNGSDRRQDTRRREEREFLDQEVERLVAIDETDDMSRALEVFRAHPTQTVLPVVNGMNEPVGIIREPDLKSFLYLSYGRDLLLNPTIDNHLKRFIRPCRVADVQAPLARLVDLGGSETADGIIMTENGRYAGWLSTTTLLKISNEARLQIAQDQNPLTKLPGNSAISDHVVRSSANPGSDRAYCYIDFDNFKPFNDTYGFRIGDRAIILFSDLLKRRLGALHAFVGHVGGDDFFVGLDDWQPDRVVKLMAELRMEFARQMESLYSAEHRRQGYIVAEDRRGRSQVYPLLSVSIAVLHLPKGISIGNLDLLSNHIARLKHRAKAERDGLSASSFGADAEEDTGDPGVPAGPRPSTVRPLIEITPRGLSGTA
ncbi:MAG: GGDEF domain-containing protein [Stappia sp.]|nr:GGDEF domain-containing protein [Stappia sp.]